MTNPTTPVLIGVGQVLNRIESLEQAIEPVDLMLQAVRLAETDTTVPLLEQVQSVRVIRGIWSYENPAAYIAREIGAPSAQTAGTLYGGNQNQVVINDTAIAILSGELDLVLMTGAEVGNSLAKARKAGVRIPMKELPGQYDVVFGHGQQPEHHEYEMARGIRTAIQVYPMYENALRHHLGETIEAHLVRVSELWSRFNDVAVGNPHAWIREDISAEQIRTPSATNRRVSFPYTKLMNANNSVDMAAALIMCSVEKARELGVPESKWVYPWAGVEGYDHFSASVRDNFYTSPGIRLVGERVFELAGVEPDEPGFFDLYSCFPSAVQIAANELGLSQQRPLTVTGGLTFGGGPLNNYVMHSVARMVEMLRSHPGEKGLVTANGGNLYKHAHVLYSAGPPARDFVRDNVQARIDALPQRRCLPAFEGAVDIESYTVMYQGELAAVAHVACLTAGGERVWVNTDAADLLQAMTTEEFCGKRATISAGGDLSVAG